MSNLIGERNLYHVEELEKINKNILEKEEELDKLKEYHRKVCSNITLLGLEEIVKEISFVECIVYNEYCIKVENFKNEDLDKIGKMYPYLSLIKDEENVFFIKSGIDNYNLYEINNSNY